MSEEMRPDPEKLLRQIQQEEQKEKKKKRGKFSIFLGYAAGVGKTYAMLDAAHQAQKNGIDVVAGYIEPHAPIISHGLCERFYATYKVVILIIPVSFFF